MSKAKKAARKTAEPAKRDDDKPRCERCGLAVTRTPYNRWKHCGNRQTGPGCGQEPEVLGT